MDFCCFLLVYSVNLGVVFFGAWTPMSVQPLEKSVTLQKNL